VRCPSFNCRSRACKSSVVRASFGYSSPALLLFSWTSDLPDGPTVLLVRVVGLGTAAFEGLLLLLLLLPLYLLLRGAWLLDFGMDATEWAVTGDALFFAAFVAVLLGTTRLWYWASSSPSSVAGGAKVRLLRLLGLLLLLLPLLLCTWLTL